MRSHDCCRWASPRGRPGNPLCALPEFEKAGEQIAQHGRQCQKVWSHRQGHNKHTGRLCTLIKDLGVIEIQRACGTKPLCVYVLRLAACAQEEEGVPASSGLLDQLPAINECFGHDRLEDIYAALRARGDAWAKETLQTLSK